MNIDQTAMMADFARRIEPIQTDHGLALFLGDILQDAQECSEGEVADLAAPKTLHALEIQGLEKQVVIAVGQIMGQLEEPVKPFIGNALMRSGQGSPGFTPVVTPLHLTRQGTVSLFDFIQALLEKLGRFDLVGAKPIADSKVLSAWFQRDEQAPYADIWGAR
jgi:hypothetical protein